jgi:hypothetical protein
VESEVKVVAGHENAPLEHVQLIEAGLAFVNVKSTLSSSGEHDPAKVTVSPEEKNPGSFKLMLGTADATVTWFESPRSF